jgi:predicted nucleotidyltransferase
MVEPSGKFVIRIPPEIHARLRQLSQRRGISLNEICNVSLESYVVNAESGLGDGPRSEHVETAIKVVGDELLGVVLFGSRARGEELETSDVDLLIVVSPSVALNRELYRRWDLVGVDDAVNPHFVHLPVKPQSAGSIWYEIALDGIVFYEHDHLVTRFLQDVRRAIADGSIKRRYSHGHPYWIKNREEEGDAE